MTKVKYATEGGEVCGLAVGRPGAFVVHCPGEGSSGGAELVSTRGEEPISVPGVLGTQIASELKTSTVWIPTWERNEGAEVAVVREVDLGSAEVRSLRAGDSIPLAIAAGGGQIFVGFGSGVVRSVLPHPHPIGEIHAPISLLAVDGEKLWAIDSRGRVSVIDLRTGEVSPNLAQIPGRYRAAAVPFGGRLWVAGRSLAAVEQSGKMESVELSGSSATDMTSCGGHLWIAQKTLGGEKGDASGVRALSADGAVVRTVRAPFPGYLACGGSSLWAATADGVLMKTPS